MLELAYKYFELSDVHTNLDIYKNQIAKNFSNIYQWNHKIPWNLGFIFFNLSSIYIYPNFCHLVIIQFSTTCTSSIVYPKGSWKNNLFHDPLQGAPSYTYHKNHKIQSLVEWFGHWMVNITPFDNPQL
jgi:hypothetical protein